MSSQKPRKLLPILLAVFAGIVLILFIAVRAFMFVVSNDPEIQALEAQERKLGDEIVYFDNGKDLPVHIYDPGTGEWFLDEKLSTEEVKADSDFDGYHFITTAAHDEGTGYTVIYKCAEGSEDPVSYAVFKFRIKDRKIVEILDAKILDDPGSYDFS